jgi:ABC-type polysaccharide/polyol phosphate export permease
MSEAAFPATVQGATAAGLAELVGGIHHWRVWHLLGVRDLRHRYARSKLGQLWLMLSTGIMIAVLSAVWSLLWKLPLRELMPFFGIGLIIWTFITQVLTDCTSIFIMHANLYRNQKMNFSVSVYSVVYKNSIMLAHNLVIIVILVLGFGVPINWYDLQIVPAVVLTWITMLWTGYIIAMTCVRYRDIIQVIVTWLTVFFFLTPVFWMPSSLPREFHFIIDYNPLAQFLELMRNPFLGAPISLHTWLFTAAVALGGGLIALPVIGRYRRRVIFWM